jgi:hypothetical protein
MDLESYLDKVEPLPPAPTVAVQPLVFTQTSFASLDLPRSD